MLLFIAVGWRCLPYTTVDNIFKMKSKISIAWTLLISVVYWFISSNLKLLTLCSIQPAAVIWILFCIIILYIVTEIVTDYISKFGKFFKDWFWNVNGLTNKPTGKEFIRNIEGYDIPCLQETEWVKDRIICFDNYQSHAFHILYEQTYSVSQGMLHLLNPPISSGISIIQNTFSEIQWSKLCKNCFALEKDLYICFAYIAQEHSSYVIRHNLDIL